MARKNGTSRVNRTLHNEIRKPVRGTESVRLPRNIPGQGRKPLGNPYKRT